MPETTDFIASDLLKELKEANIRRDNQIRFQNRIILVCFISMILLVLSFLLYLNQYDYTNTTTQSAEGVYAIIDSEGNIVSTDFSTEEISSILEDLSSGQSICKAN